jgi:FKBP-type peptidyl-prolyl cis-trans isomerase
MRFWRSSIAGGLVGLAVCGCEEPSELITVAPPGAVIPKTDPAADPAQAVGEAAPLARPTSNPADVKPATATATAKGKTVTTAGGVKYETLKEGTGPELQSGHRGLVHYEGKLENGTVFDTTRGEKIPRGFMFGTGQVIKGWDEAIPGMKVGEIRRLTIPPEMAYGKQGRPEIPPNSTLIFEVELVEVQ